MTQPQPTRVVVDDRYPAGSGIGRYVTEISCRLDAFDDVDVRRLSDLVDVSALRPFSIAEQLLLPKMVRRARPDVVWFPHLAAPLIGTRGRRVTTVHDLLHVVERGADARAHAESLIVRSLLQKARLAGPITTVSRASAHDIGRIADLDPSSIPVIPPGLDHVPEGQPLAFEDRKRAVLYVGNLKRHKNVDGLLDAWTRIRERGSDLELWMVGPTSGLRHVDDGLMRRLRGAPGVKHMGVVSDGELQDLLASAACLVMPSFYEGFGIPPLEAMRLGTPCVVSDIPALRESCSDAAVRVEPANAEAFASAVEHLTSRPDVWRSFTAKGQERARKFLWADSAAALRNVLVGGREESHSQDSA